MDILRTQVGRQFCKHLNTRGKREVRRVLMRQFRWIRGSIHSDLQEKFGGAPLKEITPAEIKRCIMETLERLAGPDPDEFTLEQNEDGGFVLRTPPDIFNLSILQE